MCAMLSGLFIGDDYDYLYKAKSVPLNNLLKYLTLKMQYPGFQRAIDEIKSLDSFF